MMLEEESLGRFGGGVVGVVSIDVFEWTGAQATLGG